MPSATATKPATAGTKRKSAEKDGYVKEKKKAKTGSDVKSVSKSKDKTKPKPVLKKAQKVEQMSESESDDSDADGGVALDVKDSKVDDSTSDIEGNDSDSEDLPKVADGLHPERAKAVVTNSTQNPPP